MAIPIPYRAKWDARRRLFLARHGSLTLTVEDQAAIRPPGLPDRLTELDYWLPPRRGMLRVGFDQERECHGGELEAIAAGIERIIAACAASFGLEISP